MHQILWNCFIECGTSVYIFAFFGFAEALGASVGLGTSDRSDNILPETGQEHSQQLFLCCFHLKGLFIKLHLLHDVTVPPRPYVCGWLITKTIMIPPLWWTFERLLICYWTFLRKLSVLISPYVWIWILCFWIFVFWDSYLCLHFLFITYTKEVIMFSPQSTCLLVGL